MKNYLQQVVYASLVWLMAFMMTSGMTLFRLYNDTQETIMGLRIQNIDTPETLTNFFSVTEQFYMVYLAVVSVWLVVYTLIRCLKKK